MDSVKIDRRRPVRHEVKNRGLPFKLGRRYQEKLPEEDLQIVVVLTRIFETVGPLVQSVRHVADGVWSLVAPYHPQELLVVLYGAVLTFFGGIFMTVVASIEAAHLFGWDKIKASSSKLSGEWHRLRLALMADNALDEDKDGIKDVNELQQHELAMRRVLLLLRSMEPQVIAEGLEGLSNASLAILATLRVKFAKAITLGTGIGDTIHTIFAPWLESVMRALLPDEYEKWVPVATKYMARYAGISMSWMFLRVTSSTYSAAKGSEIMLTGLVRYGVQRGVLARGSFAKGDATMAAAWAIVAAAGVLWQLSNGYRLPFPLSLVLFPVTVFENILMATVGSSNI